MNDLTLEARQDLRADIAKRKAELIPHVNVTVEYEAGRDCNERGSYTWFDVTSFIVCGRDVSRELEKALGRDGMKKLANVIEGAMIRAGEEPE